VERGLRAGAIAGKLRRLRRQQQRQRIMRPVPSRRIGMQPRGIGIAVTDRE
jgi:hypothetical protein